MKYKILNTKIFHLLTKEKWANESLDFFKCKNCNCIVVGIPDCHIAFIDPSDLDKKFDYNLPRKMYCPHCKIIWYDGHKIKKYEVEDVTLDELLSSEWKKIFDKK